MKKDRSMILRRFQIAEIHEMIIAGNNKLEFQIDGENYRCWLDSIRLKLFSLKGICCVKCGRKGKYYLAEFNGNPHPCLNLYASGQILMTKDHIFPRSKGGSDRIDNLETMCARCNSKKSDTIEERVYSVKNFHTKKAVQAAISKGIAVEGLDKDLLDA